MNLHGQTLSFIEKVSNRPAGLDDPLQYQAYGDFLLFATEDRNMIDAFIKSERANGFSRTPDTPIRFFEYVTKHYWGSSTAAERLDNQSEG
jgi:hypothetical protein